MFLFSHVAWVRGLSLQSKDVTYFAHAVHGCIKLQSKQTFRIRMTVDMNNPLFDSLVCSGSPQ